MSQRSFVISSLVALALALTSGPATAQTGVTAVEAREIARDAYVYGYPMVFAARIDRLSPEDRRLPHGRERFVL